MFTLSDMDPAITLRVDIDQHGVAEMARIWRQVGALDHGDELVATARANSVGRAKCARQPANESAGMVAPGSRSNPPPPGRTVDAHVVHRLIDFHVRALKTSCPCHCFGGLANALKTSPVIQIGVSEGNAVRFAA